jgi:hypothetical protein
MSNRAARRKEKALQRRAVSQPDAPMPSPSRGLLEAKLLDNFAPLRDGLSKVAARDALWAGIPMPLDGERLIIEPSYPGAKELSAIGTPKAALGCHDCAAALGTEHAEQCRKFEPGVAVGPHDSDDGWSLINEWYSPRWRCNILIMRDPNGRIVSGKVPAFHHVTYDLHTLGCSDAWGLEQEQRALQLLGDMVRHRQMKQYVLTGMFLEKSQRSGVTYMFRRLKPTVAIAPSRNGGEESMRILACLCLHPIAYYAGSWAGGMCPTDDVVAALSLMRGDEHYFWKKSNQHPPYRPEAGL